MFLKKSAHNLGSEKGFTLIEILIVILVLGFVSAISVFSINSFNNRQVLVTEAEKIISRLELAQSMARNGERGEELETTIMLAYIVDLYDLLPSEGGNTYLLKKQLNQGTSDFYEIEEEYTLNENISLTGITGGLSVGPPFAFYFDFGTGNLKCINAVDYETSLLDTHAPDCDDFPAKITLQNQNGDNHYIYIDEGGVIYEKDS